MQKFLSSREIVMLALLALLGVLAAYYLLFYVPTTDRLASLEGEASTLDMQVLTAKAQADSFKRMQAELADLKDTGSSRPTIATYDNLKQVMTELNRILENTEDFSLSFGAVDASQELVKRQVSLTFTCNSYGEAKQVLNQLQDSASRSLIKNLSMTLDGNANVSAGGDGKGKVTVSATLLFFEYKL